MSLSDAPRPVRIGIVDSGVAAAQPGVVASAGFVFADAGLYLTDAVPDQLQHGSRVARIIRHHAPDAELLVAQVFRERLSTTAAQVAAAVDWLVAEGARLINLSLGLREARPVLAEACARALQAGVLLCAASPARGAPVYPAAFPGVLRVTGDARCALDEISWLASGQADCGAHVRPLDLADERRDGSGASMACAHLSGQLGRYLGEGGGPQPEQLRHWLATRARYHGVELRRS